MIKNLLVDIMQMLSEDAPWYYLVVVAVVMAVILIIMLIVLSKVKI